MNSPAPGAGSPLGNALELLAKLGGLGVSAAGGALGPVFYGVGQTLENRRTRQRDEAVNALLQSALAPVERTMTLPGATTSPGGGMLFPPNPPETRTYETEPRPVEFLRRIREANAPEPVASALLSRALGIRLPDVSEPPELVRERRMRAIEAGVPGATRPYAEALVEGGVTLPPPDVHRGAMQTLENEIGSGLLDPSTPEGVGAIIRRGAELGLPPEKTKGYTDQWRLRKEAEGQAREGRIRQQTVPQWRRQRDALQGQVPEGYLRLIDTSIDAAETDPTPANVNGVRRAFESAVRGQQQAQQAQARLASIDRRMAQTQAMFDARMREATRRQDAAAAERVQRDQRQATHGLIADIEREIRLRESAMQQDLTMDQPTRQLYGAEVNALYERLRQLEQTAYGYTGQAVPAPTGPPRVGGPPSGAGQPTGVDDLAGKYGGR